MVREWIIYGFQIMQNTVKYWKISGNAFVGNGWDVVEKYIREQDVYEYNRKK